MPTFTELAKRFKLRGGEKKLAKKILMEFERKRKGPGTGTARKPAVKASGRDRREPPPQTHFVGTVLTERGRTAFLPVLQKKGEPFPATSSGPNLTKIPEDVVTLGRRFRDGMRVESVLGPLADARLDSKMIAWKFNLPTGFPAACVTEAEALPSVIRPEEHRHRVDLRGIPFVTIDGADAKDFDDAVALADDGSVWVAIADVAHFVRGESALDDEAAKRGNSFYFPDSVVPMLPEKISNFLCSLRPREDKLCVAVRLRVDPSGAFTFEPPVEGVMHSRARLTYEAVDRFFSEGAAPDPTADVGPMLTALRRVTEGLFARRMKDGGVDFDLSEVKFILDDQGRVAEIKRRFRTPAQGLIEELMLAANRAVAMYLQENRVPGVYRVHDVPDDASVGDFIQFLEGIGMEVEGIDPSDSREFNRLLKSLGDGPEMKVLRQMALRTMKQAYYAPRNRGHYGLGFRDYLHFTSPIRRYSDLIVHRGLKNHLHQRNETLFPESFSTLDNLCLYISNQERVAQKTEFEIRDVKSIRYLEDNVGKIFSGVVTTAIPAGLFVELEDTPIEGFIHVSKLGDDHYLYREDLKAFMGKRTRKRLGVTDRVRVRLTKASLVDLRIDLQPVQAHADSGSTNAPPPARPTGRRPTEAGRGPSRRAPRRNKR